MLTAEGKRYVRRTLQYRLFLFSLRLTLAGFALALLLFRVLDGAPALWVTRVCAVLLIADMILIVCAMVLAMITDIALVRPIRKVSRIVAGHTYLGMVFVDLFRAPLSPRRRRDEGVAPAPAGGSAPE